MPRLIIIPTYNERDNIIPLIKDILTLSNEFEILVVDDGSPDGTAAVILESFSQNPRVHLLQRSQKLGLGTAYAAGFRYALEQGYSSCITMDADFSHNPKHIPDLANAEASADMVIGSRYVPGGKTVNWGLSRKFISRCANLLAHKFLAMKSADCTSGFRLYPASTLKKLDFESIEAEGYSYLIEILYRASSFHLRIAEVPITFVERREGKSKISRKEIFKAMRTILRLRFHPIKAVNMAAA
jgi:glycosyltransferase involved in cell wall biosynthesis